MVQFMVALVFGGATRGGGFGDGPGDDHAAIVGGAGGVAPASMELGVNIISDGIVMLVLHFLGHGSRCIVCHISI